MRLVDNSYRHSHPVDPADPVCNSYCGRCYTHGMATLIETSEMKRGRFRLHRSTWAILLPAAAALVLVMVPAEYAGMGSTHRFGLPPPYTTWLNYDHGWPWTFLQRQYSPQSLGISVRPGGRPLPERGVPWLEARGWSFAGAATQQRNQFPRGEWHAWALAADIGVAVAGILAMAFFLEWRRRRRRAWQFSLADLLGAMLIVCGGLGWWMWHVRQHQAEQAFVQFLTLDANAVVYRGPAWLRRAVGQDNLPQFNRIISVELSDDHREQLPKLAERLPALERLDVRYPLEDEDFAHVARLRRLSHLTIDGKVTDAGLRHIGRMTSLSLLSFNASLVTDAGLEQLRPLRKLEYFYPSFGRMISPDGFHHLASLPRLKFISLWGYELDDRDLEAIAGMANLTGIHVQGSITSKNLDPLTRLAHLDHLRFVDVNLATRDLSALMRCKSLESVEWDGMVYFGRQQIIDFVLGY